MREAYSESYGFRTMKEEAPEQTAGAFSFGVETLGSDSRVDAASSLPTCASPRWFQVGLKKPEDSPRVKIVLGDATARGLLGS